MRTTLRLPDSLLQQAKTYALTHGKTLTQVMEESLRATLNRHLHSPRAHKIKLPTYKGQGLCPGVDLDDTSALLDQMEKR